MQLIIFSSFSYLWNSNFSLTFCWIFKWCSSYSSCKSNVGFLRNGEIVSRILQWKQKNDFVLEMKSNRTNLELIFIRFFEYFFAFKLQVIKSKKFLKIWFQLIVGVKLNKLNRNSFHWIVQILFAFRINRIADYWIEQILNEFQFDYTLILFSVLFVRCIYIFDIFCKMRNIWKYNVILHI